jgi:WD40 repeat protein/serine/threonine protein kinase/DNA-binding SARP family transcriptional activator
MLEVRLLGQFDVKLAGAPVDIPSRPAQSLLAYLILNAGTAYRRGKLAGLLWPDVPEANARRSLRQALWHIRSVLEGERDLDYLSVDEISIAFDSQSNYWLDAAILDRRASEDASPEELISAVTVYHGELLPGFYEEWVVLERERLEAVFERKMQRLLDSLVEAQRWEKMLEWSQRWIALGHVPEPAYRALMIAHAGLGDLTSTAAVFRRCREALRHDLGVEPSESTRALYERLTKGEWPAAAPPRTPFQQRYRLGPELGRGGMGVVYRARDTLLDRAVAVKMLSQTGLGTEGRARLLREAQATAKLNHPNIVSVYDAGETSNTPYIVMELVGGDSLDRRPPATLDDIVVVARQICAALEHAHAHGIVHRDLKPENVLIAPDGTAKLMDFGLAHSAPHPQLVPTGTGGGTAFYLAPELLRGEAASPQSDLYALGVMLYELVTGRRPLGGETTTDATQPLHAPIVPPGVHNPSTPLKLDELILRLLSQRPGDRPAAADVLQMLESLEAAEAPAPGEPPFKGLQYFEEADADLFFGREVLIAKLVAQLSGTAAGAQGRQESEPPLLPRSSAPLPFLAIVGASGSGKSSIVRAGLIPVLKRRKSPAEESLLLPEGTRPDGNAPAPDNGPWQAVHLITPTAHPLEALADCLTRETVSGVAATALRDEMAFDARSLRQYVHDRLSGGAAGQGGRGGNSSARHHSSAPSRLCLVIDQFEELFTLCRQDDERAAFVGNLMGAVMPEADGIVTIVIALRADFYAHCAQYADLREALARHQEYIGPMSAEELRQAIEEPALRSGWEFESGLVDLLLREAGSEPGALPLLSHALLETWHRRRGRTLTLKGYAESGGIHGAIAKTAETVFQKLQPEQQAIARSIFLRLTELGEGTQDTRRRAALSELVPNPQLRPLTESVLKMLTDARLITTGAGAAEVAHEALIREWPTLRQWLAEDREGLKLHRHLTEAAQEWEALGREQSELYRGARLAQALEWAPGHQADMNSLEHEFLQAAQDAAKQEESEREAQRQRELEAAQRLAEAERRRAAEEAVTARRLQRRSVILTMALFAAGILAVVAFGFSQQAIQNARKAAEFSLSANQNASNAQTAEAVANVQRATAQAASTQAIANEATATVAQGQALESEATAQADFARAESQRLAVEAIRLLDHGGNSELVALLSLRSLQIGYSPEGDTALLGAMTLDYPRLILSQPGAVDAVAFSPDGRHALTGSRNPNTVQLWDLQTGKIVLTFEGHTGPVVSVAFSPDGKYALTASEDTTARLWDAQTGHEIRQFAGHTQIVQSAVFSPEGKFVLTGSRDGTARLWDAQTGAELRTFTGHKGMVLSTSFSPDGRYALTGSDDHTARLWDIQTGRTLQTFVGHTDRVLSVAFSPDGQYVLTGSYDNTARLWGAHTGKELLRFVGHTLGVTSVAFSPDGQYVLTGSGDNSARLWDVHTGKELRRLNSHVTGGITSVAFSPDGHQALTGGNDQTIRLWDLSNLPGLPQFIGHTSNILSVTFSPDGRYVLTGGNDMTARLWDARTGAPLRVFAATDIVQSVAFSPNGQYVAAAAWNGITRVWDAQTGDLVRQVDADAALVVAFSPDDQYLLTSGWGGVLHIWNLQTGADVRQFAGHTTLLYSVTFSPDAKYLLTGSYDRTAKLWDFQTGTVLRTFSGHTDGINDVAFSHDGKYVLTASLDTTAKLWDAQTGAELRTFTGHTGIVWSAEFSPDDKYVVTSGGDNSVRLWDPQTGKELRRFVNPAGVESVAFSPDGKYILTGNDEGVARLWYTDYHDAIRYLCSHLLRDFSPAERAQYNLSDSTLTCPKP